MTSDFTQFMSNNINNILKGQLYHHTKVNIHRNGEIYLPTKILNVRKIKVLVMNQFDLSNFSSALEHCLDADENVRNQVTQMVLEFRSQNLFGFLEALLNVIINPSSIKAKRMALIMAYQTFQNIKSPDSTLSRCQFMQGNSPTLLDQFLTATTTLFAELPNDAGNLFAVITIIFLEDDENCQIVSSLMQQIENVTDLNFIEGAFIGLEGICKEIILPPPSYQPILSKIFTLFGQPNITDSFRSHSINILTELVEIIDEVFSSPENCQNFLNVVFYSLTCRATKEAGYKCAAILIKHRFQQFFMIAEKVLPIAAADLTENCDDEQITIAVCRMIKQMTKMNEDEFDGAKKEILVKSIGIFFPLLIQIAKSHGMDQPEIPESFHSHIMACILIGKIMEAIPDHAGPAALNFAQTYVNAEQPELREISCHLFAYCICSCEPNMVDPMLPVFLTKFTDPSLRIKEVALFIIECLIKRDVYYNAYRDRIISLIPQILGLLTINNSVISSTVCTTIGMINDYPNFVEIFNVLIQYVGTNDHLFSDNLFDCMSNLIKNMKDYHQLVQLLPILVELVVQAIGNNSFVHNQTNILYMFTNVCTKAQRLMDRYMGSIPQLLFECYNATQNYVALYCLSAFAAATQEKFDCYIKQLVFLLLKLVERYDSNPHLQDFSSSLVFLSDFFDLREFSSEIARALIFVMQNRTNDLTVYSEMLKMLRILVMKYFDEATFAVVPCIHLISEPISKIDDVVDDEEREEFINSVTEFLIELIRQADPQVSGQWFELCCRTLYSAAVYIDVDEQNDIYSYSSLFVLLFEMNPEVFVHFFSQNQKLQEFIASLMAKDDNERLEIKKVLTGMNINIDDFLEFALKE